MQETRISPEQRANRIRRKDLINSLLIGVGIGILVGAPIGWFTHRVYAQQRAAQVLLCRQQNFGVSETILQSRCGNLY